MSTFDFEKFSVHLGHFNFNALFIDVLGWSHPPVSERKWQHGEFKGIAFQQRMVAELSGVAVLEIACDEGWPDETTRMALWRHLSQSHYENLLIFLDRTTSPSQSLWYWVKRVKDAETGKQKSIPRRHEYFRGQPADLFASKLKSMVVELSELDERGRLPVLDVVRRMETALDIEKTTKRFYDGYKNQHDQLLLHIQGIENERDRRWYASVILNRLMFVWFLQKKFFLDNGDEHYLLHKLEESRKRRPNSFYGKFLNALFFEAFAKPVDDRSPEVKVLTGAIPYLNGGLFLHHKLEEDADGQPRVGITLHIPDVAFDGVFKLFADYSWHLDDTPAGNADELNPDVLGYIFEKYINQKAFGAYYTRPEMTAYLAEQSIHRLILERVREDAVPTQGWPAVNYPTVADMLARMDARIALRLVNEVLPSLTILDPAVGSGAFLVAALKVLINIYYAIVGRAELGASTELDAWLKSIRKDHPSVGYYIKRKIVTDNLHGVDIMEEACEIAKLRLFLAMVSSVRRVEDLEPLPNIDFNILPGNSLVGLIHVDPGRFDSLTSAPVTTPPVKGRECDTVAEPGLDFGTFSTTVRKDMTAEYRTQSKVKKFSWLLEEKNRKLAIYRDTSHLAGQKMDLRGLRDDIDNAMKQAGEIMNHLLQDCFTEYGIKFEQAVWDKTKGALGKPAKRAVTVADVEALHPFHWGYVFDEIVQKRGGFDIILTNPPWEILKPNAKEFFEEYSLLVSKNKMTIKEFEKEQEKLLKDPEIRAAWLEYLSRFPHLSAWFRTTPQFKHQSAIVGGRKTGSDINLYKLFTEQCFNLLRDGGECGIVIPSGIYTDLGAKGLRDLLFDDNRVTGLFCFENRKIIFEGVDSRFKFVVLTFEKGGTTERFPTAFMRHDVAELERFPMEGALDLKVELIRRLSPDSLGIIEFTNEKDLTIADKFARQPLLGTSIENIWNVSLQSEFHMTNDSKLFYASYKDGMLPLYEGKMIHQYNHDFEKPRYWVLEKEARKALVGRAQDKGQKLDYQEYRLGCRKIARNTDERTMISTIIPPNFHAENFQSVHVFTEDDNRFISRKEMLYLCAAWNCFSLDYQLRLRVTANVNFFYIYQLPVPRLTEKDPAFRPIVERAARLICTTPEFDDLAKEAGMGSHKQGVTDAVERARLRAELDGLIAHLYGLTEEEFTHILGSFPLVAEPIKIAAQNAYRDVERGLIK